MTFALKHVESHGNSIKQKASYFDTGVSKKWIFLFVILVYERRRKKLFNSSSDSYLAETEANARCDHQSCYQGSEQLPEADCIDPLLAILPLIF